jgi:cold shock CspA family protein
MKHDHHQDSQGAAILAGTIVDWVDEKDYGWVKSGEKRLFVHNKDFEPGQRRPKAGEAVRFIQGSDAKGRMCATNVAFVKANVLHQWTRACRGH